MGMGFGLQLFTIKRSLVRHGIDPELFDTRAHIDRSLRLHENIHNVLSMHGVRKKRDYASEREEERKRERKRRANKLRQTGVSDIEYDRRYRAKRPGKRISHKGRRYYERRSNRSDVNPLERL